MCLFMLLICPVIFENLNVEGRFLKVSQTVVQQLSVCALIISLQIYCNQTTSSIKMPVHTPRFYEVSTF